MGNAPEPRDGATLLAASWRDLDLDVHVVRRGANAIFTRGTGADAIPIARAVDARFVSPRVAINVARQPTSARWHFRGKLARMHSNVARKLSTI